MPLRLGDIAPTSWPARPKGPLISTNGPAIPGGVLFSHRADYTPVCTTELGALARAESEFEKRNVKVIEPGVDALKSH
jgi:alkyl hydroperoxide reductase subunit AhpC